MIVAITGAFRNAGDHLIVERALKLLKKYSDKEVININRKKIKTSHYNIFNKARAVILCGGPAYQENMYPGIYDIDTRKVHSPIIPMGLGSKQTVKSFRFSHASVAFIKHIHKNISFSGARDDSTVKLLKKLGIKNVLMTGCPAWYDTAASDSKYKFKKEHLIKNVAFTVPAVVTNESLSAMKYVRDRFPSSLLTCAFHHGFFTGYNIAGIRNTQGYLKAALYAKRMGYMIADLNSAAEKMRIYDNMDLHLGYRVHAHIYFLSRRKPSLLISEDSRAKSQSETLGIPDIDGRPEKNVPLSLKKALDYYFITGGRPIINALTKIKCTFKTMKLFLDNI